MKSIRRGIAVLLAVLLIMPNTSALAEEPQTVIENPETEESTASQTGENSDIPESDSTKETEQAVLTEETSSAVQTTEAAETASTEQPAETEETEETEETTLTEQVTEASTETEVETVIEKELQSSEPEEVFFNTGNKVMRVTNGFAAEDAVLDKGQENRYFDENGAYTIHIPEKNPFFPYEVQFTYNGETSNRWFMTPDDCVEIGGHIFYIAADFDGTVVTQMSLNVAGTKVVIYPEEKTFTDSPDTGNNHLYSLLPLEEKPFTVDLSAFTPAELTMVSVTDVFKGQVELKATDKIIWTYDKSGDDYTISSSGDKLDLSINTYYTTNVPWQMIVGSDDQLDAKNTRCLIDVKVKESRKWLAVVAYTQNNEGKRKEIGINNGDYQTYYSDSSERRMKIEASVADMGNETQAYVSLKINPEVFAETKYASVKVYEGKFTTAEDTVSAQDITNKIWNSDMSQLDAGYILPRDDNEHWVTMVTYDNNGNVTGCLPFYLQLGKGDKCMQSQLYQKTDWKSIGGSVYIYGNKYEYSFKLPKEYAVNGKYCLVLTYKRDDKENNSGVTAAYIGKYDSIAEAKAANAQEVKNALFNNTPNTGGYEADYSQGVTFSIFIGEDGTENQEKYIATYKTVEYQPSEPSKREPELSGKTLVNFTGISDIDNDSVYCVKNELDSYGDFNYLTMIVDTSVDLKNLAPIFDDIEISGINLYAEGSNTPEVSGVTTHDFSQGPVHYTAASENGENQRNYWLQIVKAESDTRKLYVNSLADTEANTRTENSVVYSKRETIIDGYHDNIHDILLINMGTESLKELSAELTSDVLELDEYWTLKGKFELSGFTTTKKTEGNEYGELSNMAKLRLRKKDGVSDGTDISGTLAIKSGSDTIMVFELTGTVGAPQITTKDIPKAVKYVPYGTMIQNNNKYSWNQVTYKLTSGKLPEGMEVKPNGELYGVPKEEGTFTFEVTMNNSSSEFKDYPSKKTFTLEVTENTDTNVDAATDTGYDVTQRIPNISTNNKQDQLFVSQGVFDEFVDVYLDGNKLSQGVDYVGESGSTRITIKSETIDKSGKGTHTLGVEFRTKENDELKRAAQNFKVGDGNGSGGGNGSGNDNSGGNGTGTGGNNNAGNSNTDGNTTASPNAPARNTGTNGIGINATDTNSLMNSMLSLENGTTAVSYTIEKGDTLWKIAQKFYGSGNYWRKIYEDNADIIKNPNRIFAGQVIIIYLPSDTSDAMTDMAATDSTDTDNTTQLPQPDRAVLNENGVTTYEVKPGDNLWKIAKQFYGKGRQWRKIYDANANVLSSPESLQVGRILVIPTR